MFVQKTLIESSYVDGFSELKLSSLFLLLQDVATNHAEELGVGKVEVLDKGLYWVITRYSVTIHRLPKYLETVVIKSYPGRDLKFIFPRLFQVESESGEILITASSTWVVIDRKTHEVVRNPFPNITLPWEHLDTEEPLPKKIETQPYSLVENRAVRYSDIDINKHLNNTRYIEYMVDMHDIDYYAKNSVTHIDINYEREILNSDSVSLYSSGTNPEYIRGEANGQLSFEALVSYKDRK